jgi:hypothetical protein
MMTKKFSQLTIALTTFILLFGDRFASANPSANSQNQIPTITVSQERSTVGSSNSTVLPNGSILATIVPANLGLDIGKPKNYPLVLILSESVGSFPAGSKIKATITSTENGNAVITANAIISNGRAIEIFAQSDRLIGKTLRVRSRHDEAINYGTTGGALGGLAALTFDGDTKDIIKYASGATIVGTIIGISSPKDLRVIEISANTLILLTVK